MDIIGVAEKLISFRTETGNLKEIRNCLNFCQSLFQNEAVHINVFEKEGVPPVIFLSNTQELQFDVLVLGHLDVVPASDDMFIPKIEDGKLYGRGALDMKSFAAVAFNSLEYVVENKLPLKFGVMLSTDEEKGSLGTKEFLASHPDISAKIVLDNDVGGDILKIVSKCKNPVFIKLKANGIEAHGSTPWDGLDANEMMIRTINNIRKIYPYFDKTTGEPENTWIDTVHIAKIHGGEVGNIICGYCEALLDFRLTDTSTVENLKKNLDSCLANGVSYEISSQSNTVVMSEDNPYIQDYKSFAEKILGQNIEFEQIGGATDSRAFAKKGSIVIMHSGTGAGMHSIGEYVDVDSVLKISEIQIKFLEKLALEKN